MGYFAVQEASFQRHIAQVANIDKPYPRDLLLSPTPWQAIAETTKANVRQLGATLSHSHPPGTAKTLKRQAGGNAVYANMCEPNYMVLQVETQQNMASLVARGILLPSPNDRGLICKCHERDPFKAKFDEEFGWRAQWLSLSCVKRINNLLFSQKGSSPVCGHV